MPRKGSVITQEDIAKAAGVSRMTVSYALRNSPMVSRKTCEQIQKLAEEMGYRPNPLVSSLMRHLQSGDVKKVQANMAMVVWGCGEKAMENNPSIIALYAGAKDQAEKAGYRLEGYHVGENGMSVERLHDVLLNRGTLGLLLVVGHDIDFNGFDLEPFTVATYGYTVKSPMIHRVCAFHLDMIQRAGLRLRDLGYQRIGMMMNDYIDESRHVFRGAYHALRATLGLNDTAEIGISDGSIESIRKYVEENELDGLLMANSSEAKRAVDQLEDVPDKLGIAALEKDGSDNKIAGMSQNNEAIGAAMVDLVVGQLNRNQRGVPSDAKTVLIRSSWKDGASVRH